MDGTKGKYQVIIAHPIPEEQRRIAKLLAGSGVFSVIHTTHDGLDCLRETVATQPDLVLVCAVLDQIDGLELLRRLRERTLGRTKLLYITSYRSYLSQHALLAGADHCILAPCADEMLLQRALDLVLPIPVVASDEEIDQLTSHILRAIGVSENKKGYYYALDGVRMLIRDPKLVMRRQMTTELYGGIAKLNQVERPERIERCLRTMTMRLFTKSRLETLEEYFNPADVKRCRITNTAFLTAIAQHVTDALQAKREAARSQPGHAI